MLASERFREDARAKLCKNVFGMTVSFMSTA